MHRITAAVAYSASGTGAAGAAGTAGTGDVVAAASSPRALRARLAELGDCVARLFSDALAAPLQRRLSQQRLALFALELVFKLQEQVLLPALLRALPSAAVEAGAAEAAAVKLARRELDLIRDLCRLLEASRERPAAAGTAGTASGAGGDFLAAVAGLAEVHAERMDALLEHFAAANLPWADLLSEIEALLARWHGEWQRDGEIEDEERDPVGLPPR